MALGEITSRARLGWRCARPAPPRHAFFKPLQPHVPCAPLRAAVCRAPPGSWRCPRPRRGARRASPAPRREPGLVRGRAPSRRSRKSRRPQASIPSTSRSCGSVRARETGRGAPRGQYCGSPPCAARAHRSGRKGHRTAVRGSLPVRAPDRSPNVRLEDKLSLQ